MIYWLYDTKKKIDSTGESTAIIPYFDMDNPGKATKTEYENNARPKIGVAMVVGNMRTTLIKEILEDAANFVKFKTHSGSVYEWKSL